MPGNAADRAKRAAERTQDRLHNVDAMRQAGISAEEIFRYEKADIRGGLKEEYMMDQPSSDYGYSRPSGAVENVYGGVESAAHPKELQLVQAWRQWPRGDWQLATGVIHRVHEEDRTVTVQFVPDQQRARVPWSSCQPYLDITPEYPEVRLGENERLPTRAEILEREENANRMRQQMGIAPDAPLPGAFDSNLRPGERKGPDGRIILRCQEWGIPATTLDALRNRSIPPSQVTGVHGQHFYSKLYENQFYGGPEYLKNERERMGLKEQRSRDQGHVVEHRMVKLDGTELQQNLKTGTWSVVPPQKQHDPQEEPERYLTWRLW